MSKIRSVSRAEMIEIDRLLMEDFGIDMIILMENAGKAVARVVRELRPPRDGLVLCLAGKGNNGGGGLVAARHLHNWGADVVVVLPESRTALKETPRRQLAILERMGLPIRSPEQVDPSEVAVVVDALLGYRVEGDPREPIASAIRQANASAVPIVALDLPSGLDASSGHPGDPCIRATVTLTLALPKAGLFAPQAKPYVGKMYLADISVPRSLYARLGVDAGTLFAHDWVVALSGKP